MDSFLKIFRIQLFSKVLYMGMLLCSSLKFIICDICNMFCAIFTHYLTQYTNFIYILSKFYPVQSFNIETTLGHRLWIDVILSTLFQRCFANVETTSINIRRLNFHFQSNINAEWTLMNFDDQRYFNVDSTLMCLLGRLYWYRWHWEHRGFT